MLKANNAAPIDFHCYTDNKREMAPRTGGSVS